MPTKNSTVLIQSNFGTKGNFELVVPSALGGLLHASRNNDASGFPWSAPTPFGSSDTVGVSVIQSNFGMGKGNLEVVMRVGDRLAHYYRIDTAPYTWYGPFFFASGIMGNPALIQSRYGSKGNFEVVVPRVAGGLAHYWRNNDAAGYPWSSATVFGASLGAVDAVALIQSNFGSPGNLEVVARVGARLAHLWRDSTTLAWNGPTFFLAAGAAGVPSFVQSTHGTKGNFELVTPCAPGGLAHLWRTNDAAATGYPWSGPTPFGSGTVLIAGICQSNFGTGKGNLEVAAFMGNGADIYYRIDRAPWTWSGPTARPCQETLCDKPTKGEWSVPFSSGVVGIHAAQLRTGKVLFIAYGEDGNAGKSVTSVLDPTSGSVAQQVVARDMFCAGQAALVDGRILVAGGAGSGVRALHTFAPDTETWTYLRDMADDRWYPTCTGLADGALLILSGTRDGGGPQVNPHYCTAGKPVNATLEIFRGGRLDAARAAAFLNDFSPYSLYPFVLVLPNGKLFVHANNRSRFLNPGTWTVDATTLATVSGTARTYPSEGTCVLLPLLPNSTPPHRPRIMLIGGAGASCPTPALATTPATNACEILDLGDATPAWRTAPSMLQPRVMPDAVLLPDATVLVMNGSSTGVADNGINPVFASDLYDPATNTWTPMCSMRVPRLYHSTALLLPDGRVLTAGKDEDFNPDPFKYPEYRVEVFRPPYLFRGARPRIDGAPDSVGYGATFAVSTPDPSAITAAAFIRPSAVTHSFNMDQRYVGLTIVSRTATSVNLSAPANGNLAPPGYYMLFLLNAARVPSVARFVALG